MKKNMILGLLAATSLFVFSCGGTDEDDDIKTSPSGSFTDSRDNQTYATIFIGGQTWMAEDLKFDTGEDTASVCYENSADSCEKYGMLYNWQAANEVCPEGYHLPDTTEVFSMLSAANINLDATNSYSGSVSQILDGGSSGIDLTLAGIFNTTSFEGIGENGRYWLNSKNEANTEGDYVSVDGVNGGVVIRDFPFAAQLCVRCVKD